MVVVVGVCGSLFVTGSLDVINTVVRCGACILTTKHRIHPHTAMTKKILMMKDLFSKWIFVKISMFADIQLLA